MKILLIVLAIGGLWSVWGYFASRVEQAEYTVTSRTSTYEIRTYPRHIVAQTVVPGDYRSGMNSGFRIVANYIFGGNVAKQPIAMTAPVVSTSAPTAKGVQIAMTAPVVINENANSQTVSFGMPKGYTMETLPTPNDDRVRLVEVPEKTVAVARFWGFRSDRVINRSTTKLIANLAKDKIETIGSASYAGYNGPGTPPWMVRNEVMIEVTK